MTKQEVQQRVLQYGKPLDLNKFEWDENTNTFSSSENNLVLDFSDINNCTFNTGSNCTFDTSHSCIFKTGHSCTFDTGYGCTFDTGYSCTFDTGNSCTFDTSHSCIFDTGEGCVVVRRDAYEVIEIPEGKTIKLNGVGVKGYTTEEQLSGKKVTVEVDGKKYTATID